MTLRSLLLPTALSVCLPAAVVRGQDLAASLDDLLLVRHRPSQYQQALTIKAGWLGSVPQDSDPPSGLDNSNSLDGYVDYRHDKFFAPDSGLRAYGGRDGGYLMAHQGDLRTEGKESRLELWGRFTPFYREGFYRDGDFIPTGRYGGRDFGARLGFATVVSEALSLEISGKYVRRQFEDNGATEPGFTVPDDLNAYGARATVEHNTLTLDRRTGWPIGGYLATAYGEWEANDMDETFGSLGRLTQLPSNLLRAGAHVDSVFPVNEADVLELTLDGQMHPEDDRIEIYDAQKPLGEWWGQGKLGYRWMLGDTFGITPGGILQYVKIKDELSTSDDNELFYGGFVRLRWQIGEAFNILADYSYLTNPSREPVSIAKDTYGEHRAFAGIGIVLGSRGR